MGNHMIPSLQTMAMRTLPRGASHPVMIQNQFLDQNVITDTFHLTVLDPRSISDASFSKKVVVINLQHQNLIENEDISTVYKICVFLCCWPCFVYAYFAADTKESEKVQEIEMGWKEMKQSEVLESLDFSQSPLRSIKPVLGFSKLHQLNLSHATLSSINGLETLTFLQEINVSNVDLNITNNRHWQDLQGLDWSVLGKLSHLKKIVAIHTEVFRFLPQLTSLRLLKTIDLGNCIYHTISENLDGCFERKIHLGVIDLDDLRAFPRLKTVHLNGSMVVDTAQKAPLIGFHLRGGSFVDVEMLASMYHIISSSHRLLTQIKREIPD